MSLVPDTDACLFCLFRFIFVQLYTSPFCFSGVFAVIFLFNDVAVLFYV